MLALCLNFESSTLNFLSTSFFSLTSREEVTLTRWDSEFSILSMFLCRLPGKLRWGMTGGGFRREEGAKKELKTERALGRGIALAAGPSHYRHLQDKRTRGERPCTPWIKGRKWEENGMHLQGPLRRKQRWDGMENRWQKTSSPNQKRSNERLRRCEQKTSGKDRNRMALARSTWNRLFSISVLPLLNRRSDLPPPRGW